MRETPWGQKHKSSLSLGPQLDNNTEAPYSHPAAIWHFCRFNGAVEQQWDLPGGQYCHWMGTAGWRMAIRISLPGGQQFPGTSAVGFSIPRAAEVLSRAEMQDLPVDSVDRVRFVMVSSFLVAHVNWQRSVEGRKNVLRHC